MFTTIVCYHFLSVKRFKVVINCTDIQQDTQTKLTFAELVLKNSPYFFKTPKCVIHSPPNRIKATTSAPSFKRLMKSFLRGKMSLNHSFLIIFSFYFFSSLYFFFNLAYLCNNYNKFQFIWAEEISESPKLRCCLLAVQGDSNF